MKKVIATVLVVLLSLSSVISVNATNWSSSDIKLSVNGEKINFPDQKPVLDEDTYRTYVPVRFLAENLGAEVYWNQDYGVVEIINKYIEGKDTKLVHYLRIGSNKFVTARYEHGGNVATKVNVYELPENVFPVILNSRTMLPFRYVAEMLGAQVYYDDSTKTAHCVKRNMGYRINDPYNYGYSRMGTPVLSTVMEEAWVEVLNEYRAEKGASPVTFDGTYADIMSWAAFHQIEHPEIEGAKRELENNGVGWMHMFEVENQEIAHEMNPRAIYTLSDGSKLKMGAFSVFIPTYLPKSSYAQKNTNGSYVYERGYGEVAFTQTANTLIIPWDETDLRGRGEKRRNEYSELVTKWGLKIELKTSTEYENWELKPLQKNQEYSNVSVYDKEAYKDFATEALNIWKTSYGHDNTILSKYNKVTGFAWVNGYCYAGFHS